MKVPTGWFGLAVLGGLLTVFRAAGETAVAEWKQAAASWALDSAGRMISLRTGNRELIGKPSPMVSVTLKDGRTVAANHLETRADGRLAWGFPGLSGEALIRVTPFDTGWTLTVESLAVTNVKALTFCQFSTTNFPYRGAMANLLSDDDVGVCLRGYDLPVEMSVGAQRLAVWTTDAHGLVGFRAGLAAGPKAELPRILRGMAVAAGVPYSTLGGPWALGAEANRGSYLFAYLTRDSLDDWIDLALRGGFEMIHPDSWYASLGHYPVRTSAFPNGLDDLREAVRRFHAAGIRFGAHTLTACISTTDPWVTPVCSSNLLAFASYTLAEAMTQDSKTLIVKEPPSPCHDVVFTYSGNGNAIRIGGEIIQYTGVRREPPYGFTGCTRGAFKTVPTAHAAGERADYLQQRYLAFYPDPDSPLADELAQTVGSIFKTCGFDEIYFDGSEGMMSRYGIDAMRRKIFMAIGNTNLQCEASCHGAHSWWFHSLIGAWDHPVWAPKRFHDLHIASVQNARRTDLLEPQLGWWAPRQASSIARGHFLDEMDYFACKNFALDAMMSIQGVYVAGKPLPSYLEKQMTVLGWYERLRLARAFDAATVARLSPPGQEFWLRQQADGAWKFLPVTMRTHRVTGLGNGSEHWHESAAEAGPASLRIEALYAVTPYEATNGVALVRAAERAEFKVSSASKRVSFAMGTATDGTHGPVLELCATNAAASSRGAWGCATREYAEQPYLNLASAGAFGFWVKGDGKGELLNLQVSSPREYMGGRSDHYVTIDFTGWRYVELLLRERDAERLSDYVWPYAGGYSLYRTAINQRHVSRVSLYLNEIPGKGNCRVAVSEIRALPVQKVPLREPKVVINAQPIPIPFTLQSGDFAELDETGWTHYREDGEPQAVAAARFPSLVAGENHFGFQAAASPSGAVRADVTLILRGQPFGEMKRSFTPEESKRLAREYALPQWFCPSKGATSLTPLLVRPGGKVSIELELYGTIDRPELSIGAERRLFPVSLQAGQRLQCRDGRQWRVIDAASRRELAAGTLAQPLPSLVTSTPVSLASVTPASADVWLKITKRYEKIEKN